MPHLPIRQLVQNTQPFHACCMHRVTSPILPSSHLQIRITPCCTSNGVLPRHQSWSATVFFHTIESPIAAIRVMSRQVTTNAAIYNFRAPYALIGKKVARFGHPSICINSTTRATFVALARKSRYKSIGWKIRNGPHEYGPKGEATPPLWLGEILCNNPSP